MSITNVHDKLPRLSHKLLMMIGRRVPLTALAWTAVSVLVLSTLAEDAARAQLAPVSAPYPPSRVIRHLDWAPKETIVRKAHDSDNWPMTWADDDALYTAYGDGYGFEPLVPEKLSLGLAKLNGMPAAFSGENIRAPSLEQLGGGRTGRKASGLLCVNSILFLWARMDHCVLHQLVGRRPRRRGQLSHQMDESGWEDAASGLFRRRQLLRAKGSTSTVRC
jgi:hypothetical protein